MGAVMDIDNGRSRIPYGMIAAAGRPAEKINPFIHVGWDELHPGGWDPAARLTEQDRDGVSAEILYPSVGMLLCNHPDADYKKACFDAYNLWIAEFQSHAPDRLIGLGQTALRSVEEGIADLERMTELGLRGAMLPGIAACNDDGDYDDHRWDPLWQAAIDLGMPLSFHILTTGNDDMAAGRYRGPKMNSFLGIIRGCQDIMGTLVFGGVFERFPGAPGRVRRGGRRLASPLDVPRRSRLRPPPQLAHGGSHAAAERVRAREHLRDVPGRLGRVPRRRDVQLRAPDVGERPPAQRCNVA